MSSTFEVVAEPNRRRILDLLCAREHSVGELVAALGLSQPAVSKHLRVLKTAHLVEAEADAQRRLYRLSPQPLLELDAWLEPYRRFWSARLDALGLHLDQQHGRPPVPPAPVPAARLPRSRRTPRAVVAQKQRRKS